MRSINSRLRKLLTASSCRLSMMLSLGIPLTAFLLLSACTARITTSAERSASFSPFSNARIADEPAHDFALRRSAFIIAGDEMSITFPTDDPHSDTRRFKIKLGKSPSFRCGTATAIDRRGYFLTASHNLMRGAPYVGYYHSGRIEVEPARIVWRGNYEAHEPDLAVLRIRARLDAAFTWSGELAPLEPALAAGLDSDKPSRFEMVCLAGTIVRQTNSSRTNPPFSVILHRTPVHPGDSGGPLFTLDGRLAGINVEIRPESIVKFHSVPPLSVAHRPNLAWLRRIVNDDYARFPTR